MTRTLGNFVSGLRELAELYEGHPELPLPTENCFNVWLYGSQEEILAQLRIFARAFGRAEKEVIGDSFFVMKREFGSVRLEVNVNRETVCVPRIVGKKKVMVKEVTQPAVVTEVEKEVDVIEWDCKPLMGTRVGSGSAVAELARAEGE